MTNGTVELSSAETITALQQAVSNLTFENIALRAYQDRLHGEIAMLRQTSAALTPSPEVAEEEAEDG